MRSGLGGSTQIKNTLLEKYIILPRASVEVVDLSKGCSNECPYMNRENTDVCYHDYANRELNVVYACKIKRIYIERE
jgi:hypothetical protein